MLTEQALLEACQRMGWRHRMSIAEHEQLETYRMKRQAAGEDVRTCISCGKPTLDQDLIRVYTPRTQIYCFRHA
jgi:hypothetical protein